MRIFQIDYRLISNYEIRIEDSISNNMIMEDSHFEIFFDTTNFKDMVYLWIKGRENDKN